MDLRPKSMTEVTPAAAAPAQSRLGNQPGIPVDIHEVIRLVDMITPHLGQLSDPQRTFLIDMRYKLSQYGTASQVTWRQVYWLRDIKDRLIQTGSL